MSDTKTIALAFLLVVVVAVGAVYLITAKAAEERSRRQSAGERIAGGIGGLVGGIVDAATEGS